MAEEAHRPPLKEHPSPVKEEKKAVHPVLSLLLIVSTFGVTMTQFFIYIK